MRSPRIIWVGSKPNDRCPYKKHSGRRHRERRRKGRVRIDAEIRGSSPKPRSPWPPGAGGGKEGFPLEPSEGMRPC